MYLSEDSKPEYQKYRYQQKKFLQFFMSAIDASLLLIIPRAFTFKQ